MGKPGKRRGRGRPGPPAQTSPQVARADGVKFVPSGGGTEISINAEELPAPDRIFSASWTFVEVDDDEMKLYFGQGAGDQLTALVIVSMTKQRVFDAMHGNNPDFLKSLRSYAERSGWKEEEPRWRDPPIGKTIEERASVMALSYTDTDADVRFYRVSPTSLRRVMQGGDEQVVYPLIEIALSTRRLWRLVSQVEEAEEQTNG